MITAEGKRELAEFERLVRELRYYEVSNSLTATGKRQIALYRQKVSELQSLDATK